MGDAPVDHLQVLLGDGRRLLPVVGQELVNRRHIAVHELVEHGTHHIVEDRGHLDRHKERIVHRRVTVIPSEDGHLVLADGERDHHADPRIGLVGHANHQAVGAGRVNQLPDADLEPLGEVLALRAAVATANRLGLRGDLPLVVVVGPPADVGELRLLARLEHVSLARLFDLLAEPLQVVVRTPEGVVVLCAQIVEGRVAFDPSEFPKDLNPIGIEQIGLVRPHSVQHRLVGNAEGIDPRKRRLGVVLPHHPRHGTLGALTVGGLGHKGLRGVLALEPLFPLLERVGDGHERNNGVTAVASVHAEHVGVSQHVAVERHEPEQHRSRGLEVELDQGTRAPVANDLIVEDRHPQREPRILELPLASEDVLPPRQHLLVVVEIHAACLLDEGLQRVLDFPQGVVDRVVELNQMANHLIASVGQKTLTVLTTHIVEERTDVEVVLPRCRHRADPVVSHPNGRITGQVLSDLGHQSRLLQNLHHLGIQRPADVCTELLLLRVLRSQGVTTLGPAVAVAQVPRLEADAVVLRHARRSVTHPLLITDLDHLQVAVVDGGKNDVLPNHLERHLKGWLVVELARLAKQVIDEVHNLGAGRKTSERNGHLTLLSVRVLLGPS